MDGASFIFVWSVMCLPMATNCHRDICYQSQYLQAIWTNRKNVFALLKEATANHVCCRALSLSPFHYWHFGLCRPPAILHAPSHAPWPPILCSLLKKGAWHRAIREGEVVIRFIDSKGRTLIQEKSSLPYRRSEADHRPLRRHDRRCRAAVSCTGGRAIRSSA